MSIKWPIDDLTGSSVLKAEHINEGSDALQNFVNEGINTAELKSSVDFLDNTLDQRPYSKKGWLESRQVYRPEFYGSPSPRMTAVSGQTHFREVQNDWSSGVVFNTDLTGTDAVAVPNTATRIKLKHKATVNIMASFYMFEVGGIALASSEIPIDKLAQNGEYGVQPDDAEESKQLQRGYESQRAGNCFLSVDGNVLSSTKRRIYTSTVGPKSNFFEIEVPEAPSKTRLLYQQRGFLFAHMIGRHQHNIMIQTSLEPGVHDIGLVYKGRGMTERPDYQFLDFLWAKEIHAQIYGRGCAADRPSFPAIKHVFFLARNFIVDCYYEDNV